jgi:hypothetical protein
MGASYQTLRAEAEGLLANHRSQFVDGACDACDSGADPRW